MVILATTAAAHGQGWRQVGELLLAFGLSSVIGLEREFRGKSAGLRTQAIVGTTAALILLVSKYGFGDVLANDRVVLDPSRVAGLVTALDFVIVLGYTPLGQFIATRGHAERVYTITYEDGRGVLRDLLAACTAHAWTIRSMTILGRPAATGPAEAGDRPLVTVALTLSGPAVADAVSRLATVRGVVRVDAGENDDE
jgi:putative Mg2+ transporter-C (MgtC) family protein